MLPALDQFWRFALAAIPLALVVGVVCRWLPCRPTTRHTLWLSVILFLVVAPFLPSAPAPDLITATPALPAHPTPVAAAGASRSSTPRAAVLGSNEPIDRPRSSGVPGASRAIRRFDVAPSPPIARTTDPRTESAPVIEPPRAAARRPDATADPSPALAAPPKRVTPAIVTPAPRPEPSPVNAAGASSLGPPPGSGPVVTSRPRDAWITGLRQVRDAVLALPAIPAVVWGGGAVMLMMVVLLRTLFFLRTVRHADPAPDAIVRMVQEAAAELKLRRTPSARMIDRRMSPMVFCGRSPVLLIPRVLWRELDETGRRAVVCHELAHLKRRDHWLCWIDLLVGCLYWWHPLVWWIRRRLHEEADLCCDAWVTALQPTARRAYATALLTTQRFTSECPSPAPAVQLGSPRTHAKRFARRLTMVMTQHNSPRHSVVGVALAAMIAGAGWMVSPTLACPPDKVEAKHKASRAKAPKPKLRLIAPPAAPSPATSPAGWPAPATAPTPPRAPNSTFERFMRDRPNQQHRGDASVEQRLGDLEAHIEKLMQHLMQWLERFEAEMPEMAEQFGRWAEQFDIGEIDFGQFGDMMKEHAHAAQEHARGAHEHAAKAAEDAHKHAMKAAEEASKHARKAAEQARSHARELAQAERRAPRADGRGGDAPDRRPPGVSGGGGGIGVPAAPGQTITRAYELPEGKLSALTALMVRADVPILVSPGESRIEVHATPEQHAIFGLFCAILHPSDDEPRIEYALPSGKLQALTELMVREDIPVLVAPGDTKIGVIGNDVEQRIFRAFVDMINPGAPAARPATGPARAPASSAGQGRSRAEAYERAASDEIAAARTLEQRLRSVSAESRKSEREADRLREKIEALFEAADEMDSEADEMDSEADDSEGRRADRAHAKADSLRAKADKMRAEAEALERKIGSVEGTLDKLQETASSLEERLASLQEGRSGGR